MELPDTALTLVYRRINEVEDKVDRIVEEEEVQRAEEAEKEADNIKTITELFNKAYI